MTPVPRAPHDRPLFNGIIRSGGWIFLDWCSKKFCHYHSSKVGWNGTAWTTSLLGDQLGPARTPIISSCLCAVCSPLSSSPETFLLGRAEFDWFEKQLTSTFPFMRPPVVLSLNPELSSSSPWRRVPLSLHIPTSRSTHAHTYILYTSLFATIQYQR